MKEIEIVILDINKEEVVKTLESLGATIIFDDDMVQVNYRAADGDRVRVRTEGKKILLNVKKPVKREGLKVSQEYEAQVGNFEEVKKILDVLNLKYVRKLKKHRTSYEYNGVHVDIDTYLGEHDYVPTFLEIEGPDEETIVAVAKELGFSQDKFVTFGTGSILKHYKK